VLIKADILAGIAAGKVTLAFRRWARPGVVTGGTLRTAVGVLSIDAVDAVEEKDIDDADAHAAGAGSRDELLRGLGNRTGQLYRIRLHWLAEDPRVALRDAATLAEEDIDGLRQALAAFDRRSTTGAWADAVLRLIGSRDGITAAEIAAAIGLDKLALKLKVRKLKELGLTESLASGYRLSPRGRALLAAKGR
jgi:hypothetical protein